MIAISTPKKAAKRENPVNLMTHRVLYLKLGSLYCFGNALNPILNKVKA